ncbi:RNB domain-containing ribonuclease [Candidatus Synechococcus spongiarum]|uniref:3'-to-5' exoribonuclease RNase R n=1 Tax=Candidatus Synechococcus spongiarum TaxID=431041 RepID=A0A164Z4I4_9SYNE|nr:RNB domain-containing ribonuclease [Candidatus Synechococcus spongiarum]SAY38719.1 3'-to-5' exoribonuclease RNase R [Candidatus Synechococcus spongiarum]
MKFSVAKLLSQLHPDTPTTITQLQKKLSLSKKSEKTQLDIALTALEVLGLLRHQDGKLYLQPHDHLVPARLRSSSKGFCFAVREGGGDIYIRDQHLNHAWDGDRVLVKIVREGGRRRSPEGIVQCVLERAHGTLLAVPKRSDHGLLVAQPLDDRLPSIQLPEDDSRHLDPSDHGVAAEVRLDRFPIAQHLAQGTIIRSLSTSGGEDQDQRLIQTKHGIFGRSARSRATLQPLDLQKREDLRSLPTLLLEVYGVSDAPQLPALSLETTATGSRLWVHTPALAERFAALGYVDLWMRERGAAICMGRRWQGLVSAKLVKASTFAVDKEQAAVSVALDLGPDGTLAGYRFCRSRIKPHVLLNARDFHALVGQGFQLPAPLQHLKSHMDTIGQLHTVLEAVRQQRLAAGSIELDLRRPALKAVGDLQTVTLDEKLQGWLPRAQDHEPMAWLREAALVANRAFGHHCAALKLPAFYVQNAPAEAGDLNGVARTALGLESNLELGQDGNAPDGATMAAAFRTVARSRALQQQLRNVVKPCTFASEPGPYMPAGERQAYAPFVGAALHYGELFNQQLLTTLLCHGKRNDGSHREDVDLASHQSRDQVSWEVLSPDYGKPFKDALAAGLCQHLLDRSRFAAVVEADWIALCQARHLESRVGATMNGVISGVQSYGLFVELPPTHGEGLVHISALRDDWYEFRARQHRLLGRKSERQFMLGDAILVEIQKVDVLRNQIDLAVVTTASPAEPPEVAGQA